MENIKSMCNIITFLVTLPACAKPLGRCTQAGDSIAGQWDNETKN